MFRLSVARPPWSLSKPLTNCYFKTRNGWRSWKMAEKRWNETFLDFWCRCFCDFSDKMDKMVKATRLTFSFQFGGPSKTSRIDSWYWLDSSKPKMGLKPANWDIDMSCVRAKGHGSVCELIFCNETIDVLYCLYYIYIDIRLRFMFVWFGGSRRNHTIIQEPGCTQDQCPYRFQVHFTSIV